MIKYSLPLISLLVGCSSDSQENLRIPVLLYHSWYSQPPCDYAANTQFALSEDLALLQEHGFTVIPLQWISDWIQGTRSLPPKPIAISFDDGVVSDWQMDVPDNCGNTESSKDILMQYSASATFFVIGSPEARRLIGGDSMSDHWWLLADSSPLFSIENHSLDHDHPAISEKTFDESLGVYLPVSGYSTGNWVATHDPRNINTYASNDYHVSLSSEYIHLLTGRRPSLFAHPLGIASDYTLEIYLPYYQNEHKITAAFCTDPEYVTTSSNRWCLPRFVHGLHWETPEQFLEILENAAD